MGNSYFQFKDFTVQQANAAMKVTTEACLFGAWVAEQLKNYEQIQTCLDIGAGTGLLSLMLANKYTFSITALEIDAAAAQQAAANFLASDWQHQLQVEHTALQAYKPIHTFDCIISNPPFFDNNLQGPNLQRTMAMHTHSLSFEALLTHSKSLLSANGLLALLVPHAIANKIIQLAQPLSIFAHAQVHQTNMHQPFRSMLLFGNHQTHAFTTESIFIKEHGSYSNRFIALLKDYYLYL